LRNRVGRNKIETGSDLTPGHNAKEVIIMSAIQFEAVVENDTYGSLNNSELLYAREKFR
jgi:hypothetical protein